MDINFERLHLKVLISDFKRLNASKYKKKEMNIHN